MKHPIQIRRLGQARGGYRVLASLRCPGQPFCGMLVDAWIPELAASPSLWDSYRRGGIGWKRFAERYLRQLRSSFSRNLLKPIALLSLRRRVTLLCDCSNPLHCPTKILAKALSECRRRKIFTVQGSRGEVQRKDCCKGG